MKMKNNFAKRSLAQGVEGNVLEAQGSRLTKDEECMLAFAVYTYYILP